MAKGAAAPPASLHKRTPKAITIAILAMGGEGGGVLADWIVDLAEHSGYRAQTTSVPGVAQRTGSTIYYLEIFPEEEVQAACKEPILALMPVPGEVDIVLASELMEAGRAIQRGLVTPDQNHFDRLDESRLFHDRKDRHHRWPRGLRESDRSERRGGENIRPRRLRPDSGRHTQRNKRFSFRRPRRNRRTAVSPRTI